MRTRIWLRKIVGGLIVFGSSGGWVSIFPKTFELPGYIYNATQWLQLGSKIMDSSVLYPAALAAMTVFGAFLLTYDWWRPRLSRKAQAPPVALPDYPDTRFRKMLPLIRRHAGECRGIHQGTAPFGIQQFRLDYLDLLAKLEALGVDYPSVRLTTEEWYRYMVHLKELAETGQLDRAQNLEFLSEQAGKCDG